MHSYVPCLHLYFHRVVWGSETLSQGWCCQNVSVVKLKFRSFWLRTTLQIHQSCDAHNTHLLWFYIIRSPFIMLPVPNCFDHSVPLLKGFWVGKSVKSEFFIISQDFLISHSDYMQKSQNKFSELCRRRGFKDWLCQRDSEFSGAECVWMCDVSHTFVFLSGSGP